MSLRKHFLIRALILFMVFIALLFPIGRGVKNIMKQTLENKTKTLIRELQPASDLNAMVQIIQTREEFIFQRVILVDLQNQMAYEAHPREEEKIDIDSHPEMVQALQYGKGVTEFYTKRENVGVVYSAVLFEHNGQKYILVTGYPLAQIQKSTLYFQLGFLFLGCLFLVIYTGSIWVIFNHVNQPILDIIEAIKPYQEGKVEVLPIIPSNEHSSIEEINRLVATLNALTKKIQGNIDTLKNFVTNAAHELRTPLTVLQGYAETLEDFSDLSPEMVPEITKKMGESCKRLSQLVKSLLTLATLDALSEERLHPTDLLVLSEKCKYLLSQSYPEAHVTLKTDLSKAIVQADPDLFELALINLLENAAKYSKEIPQIEILIKRHGSEISLTVSDHGIGIPEADLPFIFDRFYTVDKSRARKTSGAGLGLSIVKTIVEKHHGSISVASELDQGTRFTIMLPISKL